MKRLLSFTLPELMVVMLLSGIVISAMYVLLQFSFSNFFNYYHSTEKLNSYSRMNYLLTKDMYSSMLLQKTNTGFEFSSDLKKISYRIQDSLLVRTDVFNDTLKANSINYELFLSNVPVLEDDAVADQVKIQLQNKEEQLMMHYTKSMDAKSFLLLDELYGNRNK